MRWVTWVVVVSACAKPGGGTPTPAPSVSGATAQASAAPSTTTPPATASASSVDALPALPSASADPVDNSARNPNSRLCEVVVNGLTMLRACTGATGEKVTRTFASRGKRDNCLVTVGDLEIIRPCEGKPNERKAPSSNAAAPSPKLCERIEHTAEGDIVTLRPCSK